jgi:hypothetical protein
VVHRALYTPLIILTTSSFSSKARSDSSARLPGLTTEYYLSNQDGPIEERSGEESGESGESGESKSEGSAEEDRDSNC